MLRSNKIITAQVEHIDDNDIHKIEISQVNNLLDKLKYFGNLSANSDKEVEETLELTLCNKLIKCPVFERKRQGMLNLVSIIEALEEDQEGKK